MRFSRPPTARSQCAKFRRLRVERLEDRRVLAGTPWQNAALPLDVDHDATVLPLDALVVINRLQTEGIGPLAAPGGGATPNYYYDINGDNYLSPADAIRIVNRLISPPKVTLDALMPFTIDLTPRLLVAATSPAEVPNGTPVHVDVDLNNDGAYAGNEINYTSATMFDGRSEFALEPALPTPGPSGLYSIKLRARLQDSEGLPGTSTSQPLVVDTQTSNALSNYVHAFDPTFGASTMFSATSPDGTFKYYTVRMQSQTWQTGNVNKPNWLHWVQFVVPTATNISSTALLYITGGSNTEPMPTTPDSTMVAVALATNSVTVKLRGVPNESVEFTAETPTRSRSEDEIIAYTLDQYLQNPDAAASQTWPLLLPMVKSAVRAMDVAQAFVPAAHSGSQIVDFLVTGYSKRGWTTWLTAAVDTRVKAIIPGVFDNLNQGPQMVHHYEVYGFFSIEVQDYTDLDIFERMKTPEAQKLSQIIDPYRYLQNGRFNIPKLVLNGAGDEFFVSDSSQFYFDDLPGEDNYLRYFPNAGHGLDASAATSVITFMDAVLNNRHLPDYNWEIRSNGEIHLQVIDVPTQVKIWYATNDTARDFRNGFHPDILWQSEVIQPVGGEYIGFKPTPDEGATAYFLELTYPSAIPTLNYVFTTGIRVNSKDKLWGWLEPPGIDSILIELGLVDPTASVPLFALPPATQSDGGSASVFSADVLGLTGGLHAIMPQTAGEFRAAASEEEDSDELSESKQEDAVDQVFDSSLDATLA